MENMMETEIKELEQLKMFQVNNWTIGKPMTKTRCSLMKGAKIPMIGSAIMILSKFQIVINLNYKQKYHKTKIKLIVKQESRQKGHKIVLVLWNYIVL